MNCFLPAEYSKDNLPYQPKKISAHIRYCLFVIDKFAGAQRLINEMKIIK
jgi:hypothetical protein